MAPILPEDLLDTALEFAVLQGDRDLESAGTFLPRNIDPNVTSSCKGRQSAKDGALRQACMAGHESIVNLLSQPCYGIKKSEPGYEETVLQAARGWVKVTTTIK
jgi:hypothetical protein